MRAIYGGREARSEYQASGFCEGKALFGVMLLVNRRMP
jgi:hypothetical protein